MSTLFKEMENTQAFLKCGLLGFAGSGKSTTATNIAIGLIKLLQEKGIKEGSRPALFLDTESGADWVKPLFNKDGIKLHVAKTRAFTDLVVAVREAEKNGSVLIIDSITHFWTELTTSYARKKNRTRGLQFQDWAILKDEWRKFTDLYVNSNVHIILCGRAGYEYDYFEGENGRKELEKTGIKMKAESETGYEASLLVLMERHQELNSDGSIKRQWRTANIFKDRSRLIDGKSFNNPTFKDFLPHIDFLNLGGKQLGVDTTRSSEELFEAEGKPQWQYDKEQKEIALDEIKELLTKHYPSQSAEAKKTKGDLLEEVFGNRSWMRIETFSKDQIEKGRDKLKQKLEPNTTSVPPLTDVEDGLAAILTPTSQSSEDSAGVEDAEGNVRDEGEVGDTFPRLSFGNENIKYPEDVDSKDLVKKIKVFSLSERKVFFEKNKESIKKVVDYMLFDDRESLDNLLAMQKEVVGG